MKTPLSNTRNILGPNPEHADALLEFLLWAVQPDTAKTSEYDEVLDEICVKLPEFRKWREEQLESRAA